MICELLLAARQPITASSYGSKMAERFTVSPTCPLSTPITSITPSYKNIINHTTLLSYRSVLPNPKKKNFLHHGLIKPLGNRLIHGSFQNQDLQGLETDHWEPALTDVSIQAPCNIAVFMSVRSNTEIRSGFYFRNKYLEI